MTSLNNRSAIRMGGAHKESNPVNGQLPGSGAGQQFDESQGAYGLIGTSEPMQHVYSLLEKFAASDAAVHISGASGTGKELAAVAIHGNSKRRKGPFVIVNCGVLPPGLIQSELFGHEKGAFTGATQNKIGRFEAANHGTIFLDEIGDLPLELQVNLLRFLEQSTIQRVGSNENVSLNVRVIAASHVDLKRAVSEGQFREDLYYRLRVLQLEMPVLRNRGGDVVILANHFLAQFSLTIDRKIIGFSHDALLAISQWHWPGNVRELMNRVQHATVMSESDLISRQDLGLERRTAERYLMTLCEARSLAEKTSILNSLDHSNYNHVIAAEQLEISRMTLYRLMKKHSISGLPEESSSGSGDAK